MIENIEFPKIKISNAKEAALENPENISKILQKYYDEDYKLDGTII